jgi:cytochrome b subunit of formate dehydrogenase
MDFLVERATNPWGQSVLIHVGSLLIWIAAALGLAFMLMHAVYVRFFAKHKRDVSDGSMDGSTNLPSRIARHSWAARSFHWVMAAAMFTLLLTGFLPMLGIRFGWVKCHWIAGAVLTVAIAFHLIHAIFWQDFWSIWPDRIDREDARRRVLRFFGRPTPPPGKSAKYPLDNKLYHSAVALCGLAVIVTGVSMMSRVRTPFFPRNPYLFSDMTWGVIYVAHGFAGVGLIALVLVHVYFAVRIEKLEITKSMLLGSMSREFFLKEHEPARWRGDGNAKGEP